MMSGGRVGPIVGIWVAVGKGVALGVGVKVGVEVASKNIGVFEASSWGTGVVVGGRNVDEAVGNAATGLEVGMSVGSGCATVQAASSILRAKPIRACFMGFLLV